MCYGYFFLCKLFQLLMFGLKKIILKCLVEYNNCFKKNEKFVLFYKKCCLNLNIKFKEGKWG